MKYFILHLLNLGILASAIFLFCFEGVYKGDVVGEITLSRPWYYEHDEGHKKRDISYTYKTKNDKIYEVCETVEKYYFTNTKKGKALKEEHKVYGRTWYTIVGGILLIILFILNIILLLSTKDCYKINQKVFKELQEKRDKELLYYNRSSVIVKTECDNCSRRASCKFIFSPITISKSQKQKFKSFFGYEENSDVVNSNIADNK